MSKSRICVLFMFCKHLNSRTFNDRKLNNVKGNLRENILIFTKFFAKCLKVFLKLFCIIFTLINARKSKHLSRTFFNKNTFSRSIVLIYILKSYTKFKPKSLTF